MVLASVWGVLTEVGSYWQSVLLPVNPYLLSASTQLT